MIEEEKGFLKFIYWWNWPEAKREKDIEGRRWDRSGVMLMSAVDSGGLCSSEAGVFVLIPKQKRKCRMLSWRKSSLAALGCLGRNKWRHQANLGLLDSHRSGVKERCLQNDHLGKQAGEATNRKVWLSSSWRSMWEFDNYFKVRPLNLQSVK